MFGIDFSFLKLGKKKESNVGTETKISFRSIQKEVESEVSADDYFLDIVTITKNKNEFEFVLNFENNTDEYIRLKLINAQLIHDGRELIGDFYRYEMNIGTNDAILKNTVVSKGNLLKNILFKDLILDNIVGNDYLIIELLINNVPCVLECSVNGSSVSEIKIIEIE